MDILLTLAEVSITMAGFSAIVVFFRRREEHRWHERDVGRFHGMVIHSIQASLFCLLPFLFREFTDLATAWIACSVLLGLAALGQLVGALFEEGASHLVVRVQLVISGSLVVAAQVANVVTGGQPWGLGLYLVGVFWHVFQAAMLFVMLIWMTGEYIEKSEREEAGD